MRRMIMVSFITAALLGGQNRAGAQSELVFFRPATVRPLVQLKTGSISGVVTDPNSHVVAGATVTALLRDADTGSTLRFFSAVSDVKGCFRFDALPIGTYEIRVGWAEMWPLLKEITKQVFVRNSENTTVEFQLQFINECAGNPSEVQNLSDSDRAEIVKWIVDEELTKNKMMPLNFIAASDRSIVISTENIESSWVPVIPDYKLLLLTPAEIQARANRQGNYMYLEFDKIRVRGSCVAISICNLWADGTSTIETGKITFLGESCLYYVFRQESGKWIGKFITGSIS